MLFYNLISEVTYHLFCCILLVTSIECINPDTMWEKTRQGHEYQMWGPLGATLDAGYASEKDANKGTHHSSCCSSEAGQDTRKAEFCHIICYVISIRLSSEQILTELIRH